MKFMRTKKSRLIFLGTGAAFATECYNASFVIERPDGELFMTDTGGGNGIIRQMKHAGLDFKRLHYIFVTHGHSDHILGSVWIVRRIARLMIQGKYDGELHIYGHDASCYIMRTLAELLMQRAELAELGHRIHFHVMEDGETVTPLDMPLTAFDMRSTKTKQLAYRLRFAPRRALVCLGDEPYNRRCHKYVEGADWLISEAFCAYDDRAVFDPYPKSHATTKEAAETAEEIGAKHLVLYHTEDTDIANRKEKYTRDAKKYFSGDVRVPDDLEVIELI